MRVRGGYPMKTQMLTLAACAVLAAVAEPADETATGRESPVRFDAGADFRLRQEIMDNLPGLPGGGPYAMTTTERAKYRNQMRFRPRAWFEVETGPLRLYARITDEFRYFPASNDPKKRRPYYFPDEVFLDNLYLDAQGLESPWLSAIGVESLDFRLGRQDMLGPNGSIFGLNRIVVEGTPTDGSRSFYSDMVRTTLHFDETKHLDVFALYDSGRNDIRWGTSGSRGRSLNCINMTDSNDLDEWGGGLVYSQTALEGHLPFKLYSIFKRTEAHTKGSGANEIRVSPKEVTTLGVLLQPQFTENWGMEVEAAKQVGRICDGNREAGGHMAHVELRYMTDFLRAYKPTFSWATTYYSGDRHRTEPDDTDTAWDPMWGRYTQDSEMLVYGTLYENCWWSNMIYTKLMLTMKFGPRHGFYVYSGPMFAAVQDHLGRADHDGSTFKGVLSAARYDFPIRLAPKNATGFDRVEVFAHVVGELFNPGDYYDSSKPAFFFRWQVDFRF